jgi:DNA repair exonuclease SbcCD nuclease subunit
MKIAHFADLHLDAPFVWARPEVARKRRRALGECLGRIVELAVAERVDAILCGGDLYENDYSTPDSRKLLREVLERAAPCPVLLAPGNHDWLGPTSAYRQIDWPGNVHVFTTPDLAPYELTTGLLIWGGAFTAPTRPRSFLDEGGAQRRRGMRGAVHLALFHGAAVGALPGVDPGPYAPFRIDDLERSGVAHAFVGHHHQPTQHDLYTYPGNPDPLEFGETGERGLVIAEIDPAGSVRRRMHRVAVSGVHDVAVDLSACGHFQAVREVVARALAGLDGVVRVDLRGEVAPDIALDLDALAQAPDGIDQIVVQAGALVPGYDFDALASEPSVRGRFVRKVRAETSLDEPNRRRVLVTGLRALAGRDDLEAP